MEERIRTNRAGGTTLKMITYLAHQEIDKRKWDVCINEARNGMIYAYSWYLDLISPGWEALVKKDYETVMPLTCNKKYGISYLSQPFFSQQLGVFSKKDADTKTADEFLGAIPPKYRFVEINLNSQNTISRTDFSCRENLNHELDLSGLRNALFFFL